MGILNECLLRCDAVYPGRSLSKFWRNMLPPLQSTRLHGVTTQMTALFIVTAVRTSYFTLYNYVGPSVLSGASNWRVVEKGDNRMFLCGRPHGENYLYFSVSISNTEVLKKLSVPRFSCMTHADENSKFKKRSSWCAIFGKTTDFYIEIKTHIVPPLPQKIMWHALLIRIMLTHNLTSVSLRKVRFCIGHGTCVHFVQMLLWRYILNGSDGGVWHSEFLRVFFFLLCPSSHILKNTTFRKLDLFPSSDEGVGDTYSDGSL
jgi:hypothetical protein